MPAIVRRGATFRSRARGSTLESATSESMYVSIAGRRLSSRKLHNLPQVFGHLPLSFAAGGRIAGRASRPPSVRNRAPERRNPASHRGERAMHALDRLTFGPRPGDLEKVEAMGVDSGSTAARSARRSMTARSRLELADYPAIADAPQDLIEDFPLELDSRRRPTAKWPLPRDPVERAIYKIRLRPTSRRKQKQGKRQTAAETAGRSMSAAARR